jgi:hypothetical protein
VTAFIRLIFSFTHLLLTCRKVERSNGKFNELQKHRPRDYSRNNKYGVRSVTN